MQESRGAPRGRRAATVLLSLLVLALCLPWHAAAARVPHRAQSDLSIAYAAGWNLVGAPAGVRFTGATSLLALAPDGTYQPVSPLDAAETGRGYWAYFPAAVDVSLAPAATTSAAIDLPPGAWALAGNPFSVPARLSGADVAYSYDPAGGYQRVALLPPGHGALVYSASGSALTLSAAPDTIRALAPPPPAPSPSATSTRSAAITVVDSGFGQPRPGGPVTAAFLLRNDGASPLDGAPVSISVYDAAGGVIGTADTSVHLLLPGETTGAVHRLAVSGGASAARIDVQAGAGKQAGLPPPGALSFGPATLSAGRGGLIAATVLSSSYANDFSSVRISAIAYDAGGRIIGGGATIKRLVPANAAIGVQVAVEAAATPARIDFYAQLP